jgi:hypothetical protein
LVARVKRVIAISLQITVAWAAEHSFPERIDRNMVALLLHRNKKIALISINRVATAADQPNCVRLFKSGAARRDAAGAVGMS